MKWFEPRSRIRESLTIVDGLSITRAATRQWRANAETRKGKQAIEKNVKRMRIVFRGILAGDPRAAPGQKKRLGVRACGGQCPGDPAARPILLRNARQILRDLLALAWKELGIHTKSPPLGGLRCFGLCGWLTSRLRPGRPSWRESRRRY